MIELLKEQVYHSNIVNNMSEANKPTKQPLLDELQSTPGSQMTAQAGSDVNIVHQLTLLQQQIEAQQLHATSALNSQLREVGFTISY